MGKVFSYASLSSCQILYRNSLLYAPLFSGLTNLRSSLFPRPGVASFVFLIFVLYSPCAYSADVTLAWESNPATDQVTSYAIYYKSGSSGPPYDGMGAYEGDSPIIVSVEEFNDPENLDYTISNLDSDKTYFFVVTATSEYGESGFSNEVPLSHSNKNLLFTPVTPCRIVDTRLAGGAIPPGGTRSYNVRGAVTAQGGNPAGCPSPKGEPLAAHINVTAVPLSRNGFITAYPYGSTAPLSSLVNYKAGGAPIANSGTVKTCFNCDKDINIKSNLGSAHAVIDVMGYYYPIP